MADGDRGDKYWYDLRSGRVDVGHERPGSTLLGPYDTRAEAEAALATAQARTEAWDREDERDA